MPINKLRHPDQMVEQTVKPLDGENLRSVFELSELCRRIRGWTPPRGVHRHRSIGEAQAHRRHWEDAD